MNLCPPNLVHCAVIDDEPCVRLRRELSEKGKECFVRGEHEKVLHFYNTALLYR